MQCFIHVNLIIDETITFSRFSVTNWTIGIGLNIGFGGGSLSVAGSAGGDFSTAKGIIILFHITLYLTLLNKKKSLLDIIDADSGSPVNTCD